MMSVLLLSPDCVYERETALVQWSSSLVYPSALHPHGQWRVVELMGLGSVFFFFFSWEHSFQTENEATRSLRKRCGLGWHANIDRQPVRGWEAQEPQWWPEVLCQKQRETQREHSLLFPWPLFLSTQLHHVLLWVLSNHFLMLLAERSGFSQVLWQPEQAAITTALGMRTLISFSL